ncbi:MAG TPA: SDR family oxidoreductase [Terrimicrobiaceae bacterium]|nr:SDR family oxidoreductase [Terrimicrobiaceae bacterium]
MFALEGKTALVTGAATGIGRGIAVAFARRGAKVILTDKPGVSLAASCAEVGVDGSPPAAALALDVRDLDRMRSVCETIRDEFGRVDILVNNAGINRPMEGLQVDPAEWDDHYQTNVKGGFFLAQTLAPEMIQAGWGRIIWISSQSGLVGIPGQPVYCSTKGAVIQLVRTLGIEWAKSGITVNSIAPTFVETDLTRKRLQNPEFLNFVLTKIPAGRLATVAQIAAAAVYLASEEAAMVNCHTLCVDGGWTAW